MKRHTPSNPKLIALMRKLGISRAEAVGTLELLWHFTAQYAPEGGIGRWSDDEIHQFVNPEMDAKLLISGLIKTGWIDRDEEHRLVIHDWCDHADQAVKRRLSRSGSKIVMSNHLKTGCDSLSDQPVPDPVPGPDPEPPENSSGVKKEMVTDLFGQARNVWPDCQAAAAGYGKRWQKLSLGRQRIMKARLEEHPGEGPDILVHAIHGYYFLRAKQALSEPSTFNWKDYLTPEIIYQASKFEMYLDAYKEHDESENRAALPEFEVPEEDLAGLDSYLQGSMTQEGEGGA